MIRQHLEEDYQPVVRSRSQRVNQVVAPKSRRPRTIPHDLAIPQPITKNERLIEEHTFLKRGHVLSFAALFLFTVVLYARPAEFYPSTITNSLALIVGVV